MTKLYFFHYSADFHKQQRFHCRSNAHISRNETGRLFVIFDLDHEAKIDNLGIHILTPSCDRVIKWLEDQLGGEK